MLTRQNNTGEGTVALLAAAVKAAYFFLRLRAAAFRPLAAFA